MVTRPVFTNSEFSVDDMLFTYGFRKFIFNVKVLTFKRKFFFIYLLINLFFYFEINFECERGLNKVASIQNMKSKRKELSHLCVHHCAQQMYTTVDPQL